MRSKRCAVQNQGITLISVITHSQPAAYVDDSQLHFKFSVSDSSNAMAAVNREYFMESVGVRYLRTSCWRIRNRTSERSERVTFLIQKQRVRKYRTKHFPRGIVFIIYILRHWSFWRPFYFKSFKNAKICATHLPQDDNENEVSAFQ